MSTEARTGAPPLSQAAAARPSAIAEFFDRRKGAVSAIISLAVGFAFWEFWAQVVVRDKLFLVAPSAIVVRFMELWRTGEIQGHMWISGLEFVFGFFAAAVIGILIGLLMGTSARVRAALTPWVSAVYATPLVALSPLLILWFGLGLMSKVVVVFAVAVFPVLVNTQTGIESVDERLLETARAFGARKWQTFTKVLLPGSVPFIVAGLRLGIGRGLVGVVVGELFGARAGVGYLITVSSQTFDMGALFAAALILAIAGVITTEAIRVVERKIAPWRWV